MFSCPVCNQQMHLNDYLTHAGACTGASAVDRPLSSSGTPCTTPDHQIASNAAHFQRPSLTPPAAMVRPPLFPCPLCNVAYTMAEFADHSATCRNIKNNDDRPTENAGKANAKRLRTDTNGDELPFERAPTAKRFAQEQPHGIPRQVAADSTRSMPSTPADGEARMNFATPGPRAGPVVDVNQGNGVMPLAHVIAGVVGQCFQQHVGNRLRDIDRSMYAMRQRLEHFEASMMMKLNSVEETINRNNGEPKDD